MALDSPALIYRSSRTISFLMVPEKNLAFARFQVLFPERRFSVRSSGSSTNGVHHLDAPTFLSAISLSARRLKKPPGAL